MSEEIQQRLKEYQKNIVKLKNWHKKLLNFFILWYKNGKKGFGEKYIIKNKFHVYERSISIDKVHNQRIVLSKKIHLVIKTHVNVIYIYIPS